MRHALERWALLVASGFTLHCATSSDDQGGPDVSDVELTVTVTDSTGSPVRAVPVRITVFRDTQSSFLAIDLTTDSAGVVQVTDTMGRAGQPPDSFEVEIPEWPGECNPFVTEKRVVERPHGVRRVEVDLEASLSGSLAPMATGESCGIGFGPFADLIGSAFWLRLHVDSITDSIRGTWRLDFQATIASLEGSFSGPVRNDSLALDLVHADPFPPCTPGFRLSGALAAGQITRLVRLEDQNNCGWNFPTSETPFWMIEYDSSFFPGGRR